MIAMNVNSGRPTLLGVESYEAVRDAINAREIDDVDFGRVSEATPTSMSPADVEEFRTQYVDELFVRNPDWDGSVRKLSKRIVFTIGQAACFEGQDSITAKSAEKVLWRQGPVLSWAYAFMLKRDIRRSDVS